MKDIAVSSELAILNALNSLRLFAYVSHSRCGFLGGSMDGDGYSMYTRWDPQPKWWQFFARPMCAGGIEYFRAWSRLDVHGRKNFSLAQEVARKLEELGEPPIQIQLVAEDGFEKELFCYLDEC